MREQIFLMLQKNAISDISPDTPGFFSNVFLVRKASGGWRPVIDLKQLNQRIDASHFRMHTISSVLSIVYRGDYAFKIDLQDAYFQLLIYLHSRKYLCFAFENKVYQFRVLHFSLNTAPHLLTCLGHTVAPYLHRQGISVIPYRNNWLISRFCGFHYSWIRGELPSQYPKLGRYGTRLAKYPPRKPCRTEKCPNSWDHSIGPQVSSHWVIYTFIH